MNAHDIELALRARAAFNDSADRIDPDTRRRLRDLRLHALKGEGRPAARARWMWPAGVATAAALALAVFIPHLPQAPTAAIRAPAAGVVVPRLVAQAQAPARSTQVATTAAPDTPEAATLETADPDMLSDLDFYGWLAKQPGNGNIGG